MSFRKIVNAGIIMKRREGSAVDLGLKGKRVVIPASTKGILRRVVDQLVDEGCDVAICSRSEDTVCLLYTSPSPRDQRGSRMPSSA